MINLLGNVINFTCECPTDTGKEFNHIATTFCNTNNEKGLSKTTFEQE